MSLPRPTPTPSLLRPRIVPRTDLREAKTVESLFSDPAFSENRDSGIHRWVPWVAGFSAAFLAEAIRKHASRGGLIVDPFAGLGTTLLETVRRSVA